MDDPTRPRGPNATPGAPVAQPDTLPATPPPRGDMIVLPRPSDARPSLPDVAPLRVPHTSREVPHGDDCSGCALPSDRFRIGMRVPITPDLSRGGWIESGRPATKIYF